MKKPHVRRINSTHSTAIERLWRNFLRYPVSHGRPPLTCIVVGGREKEYEIIKFRAVH
jgi:hypothetical protein